MSYRPYTWAVPGIKQKMRQSPSPYMFSAKHMNINQPLSRASTGAEWVFQQRNNSTNSGNNKLNNSNNNSSSPASPQQQQRKNFSSYYYQFPKIPRPKRNVLYYSTWSKGTKLIPIQKNIRLPNIIISRRLISNANQKLKLKTKSIHNRFFSVEARRKRQQRRRFIRWWTMTSLAVVIGGVAAKIRYDRGDTGPRNQYQIKPQLWQLYAYSTLPLKAISRLWGKVNSIDLPVWMRSPAYRFYSACFGVNLDEMDEPDLTTFRNLSEFFYRTLKPGVRPIADSDLVSPSDGKVLGFGAINNGEIEQVKGMTYSIEALLGLKAENLAAPSHSPDFEHEFDDETILKRDSEFAELNGITYHDWIKKAGTLPEEQPETFDLSFKDKGDRTHSKTTYSKQLEVAQDLAPDSKDILKVSPNRQLFFAVIYLAPGDYHRYHSPANWVTTLRRHFIGELFSVAPFFQKTLQGLFVLNERVALLGYWKYGFFSMIPVGATNVGSIVVNFDKDLKTNERYENEVYSKASADESTPLISNSSSDVSTISSRELKKKKLQKNTVYEATYSKASSLLGGYPLSKGQEVGGFKLGSTVVLVFEAPDNFKFNLSEGQKVKMGQSLGGFE